MSMDTTQLLGQSRPGNTARDPVSRNGLELDPRHHPRRHMPCRGSAMRQFECDRRAFVEAAEAGEGR
jgi:hypothetical protein